MGKAEKRKAEKDALKAQETPEERHARRLAKKKKKHGEDAEYMGYKASDNRFGDANLGEQFTWRKKIDKMVATGHDPRDMSRDAQREHKRHLKEEIEKLKRHREERDREKEVMDEERERLSRERESMNFQEWESKEEEFHRQQSKTRTEIRIAKGRARPIDLLTRNLLLDDHFDMEMNEPFKILRTLKSTEELSELLSEMKQQAAGESGEYWNALIIVCHDELELRETNRSKGGVASHGVHSAVKADLDIMFQGKSTSELNQLATEVNGHIENGGGGDVEYWESLMKRLKVHRAKAQLRDISQDLLRQRLKKLQSSDGAVLVRGQARAVAVADVPCVKPSDVPEFQEPAAPAALDESVPGNWSPELLQVVPVEDQEFVMSEEADWKEICDLRRHIDRKESAKVSNDILAAPAHSRIGPSEDDLYKAVAQAAEGDTDTVAFGDEVALEPRSFLWHDKYRPRKPRYFNRVHTGFEWNKYNQTHYDHDNPPPKVVQGYKINVFYPDLIDKTKAPEFFITKDPDGNKEVAVLRISAGPPYEDIAFKILNREWEYSHKQGYKCSFERGIFHLCFNFKKHRYRR